MNLMDIMKQVPTTHDITDKQTIIIQYDEPTDLFTIRSYIRSLKHHNAEAIINDYIRIDCFVALNGADSPKDEWVRIIYHCTKHYTDPIVILKRFPGCIVLHADMNFFSKGEITNDTTRRISEVSSNEWGARNIRYDYSTGGIRSY